MKILGLTKTIFELTDKKKLEKELKLNRDKVWRQRRRRQ